MIAIVWNPGASGAADRSVEDLKRSLEGDGATVTAYTVTDEQNPCACARAAVAAGATTVIAAGGDGTVSAVASELVGRPVRLGVVPLGTSNSFAAAMGIDGGPDAMRASVQAGSERVIDLARVTCAGETRTMIMHCMIGIHANAIGETSSEAKQRWGVLAYLATAAQELSSLESFVAELTVNDRVIRCRAIDVAIANLAAAKTVLAHGPSAISPDDGLLDVTIVAGETIAGLIAAGVHLYRTARQGEAASRDDIGYLSCARVQVDTTPPQSVLVDGELVGKTPVTVEVIPGAIRVLAPPAGPGTDVPHGVKLGGLPELEIGPAGSGSRP